jgi:hypothetical protein
MDAVLALVGIRAIDHTHKIQGRPHGNCIAKSCRTQFLPLLLAALASTWVAGCDRADSESRSATERSQIDEATDSVLPDVPWFELPENWDEQHPILSPNAKIEAHLQSLAEKQVTPNPADGGGRAWLEAVTAIDPDDPDAEARTWRRGEDERGRPSIPAASIQRIELSYEAGEYGIDEGGRLFVMPEPFWSWSETQVMDPDGFGYTTATARNGDVEIVPEGPGSVFQVVGRALEPGERIDIVVGAGPRGTRVDEFAERGSEILIAVDGDGDGSRRWLGASVQLDIIARAGVRIVAFGPAEVAPGEPIEVSVAIVDANGNRARWPVDSNDGSSLVKNDFSIESLHTVDGPTLAELGLSETLTSRSLPDDPHRIRFSSPNREGVIRLTIRGHGPLEGFRTTVNPIVVRDSPTRLAWSDLHGHSRMSDGTGTPDDYFSYARDVARLDVIALTDHDHWSVRPLDEYPKLAESILQSALSFHEPGRFVTIPGYEWTNWLHGHRHVLYFAEKAPIFSAIDPATDRPDELWDALRGKPALTFAHHSAGEPVATNWFYAPDPELEPLTEISSVHGMSEAEDAPLPVLGAIPGNFVRDALLYGYKLGFVGSGDSHDGHPGLAHLVTGQSGLAAIFTESLDRPGLLAAMKQRRTFATNGIRPWMEVFIDETFMGSSLPTPTDDHVLRVRYEATAPIERIDLVRSGRIANLEGSDRLSVDFERSIPRLQPGEFHYVRIIQEDGGVAWSSPIFVDTPDESSD